MHYIKPDSDPSIMTLLDAIDAARSESYPLFLGMRRLEGDVPSNPTDILDALAREEGYQPLGSNWIEVPRRIALKIATHLIASELAYPTDVVAVEEATDLATQFLDFFSAPARYFTNGACSGPYAVYDLAGAEVVGWRSLSAAPFDNGVIVLNAERVGMLWAEDAP